MRDRRPLKGSGFTKICAGWRERVAPVVAILGVVVLVGAAGAEEAAPKVTQISARYHHTVLLRSDGKLLACGDSAYGKLGFATSGDAVKASFVDFEGALAVSAGGDFTLAVKSGDNSVWAWGDNVLGQLGNGGDGSTVPVQVLLESELPLLGIASVSAGLQHAVAAKQDGSVWAWGANGCGQAGHLASGAVAPYAVEVPLPISAAAVAAGDDFSLALGADADAGTVYAWGCNEAGQLGNGGGDGSANPVQVLIGEGQPLTDVASITANGKHAVALKADGTVWSWGAHQGFGPGTTDPGDHPYAVQVSGLGQIEAVAAGAYHNVALIEATETLPSALWGWGDTDAGKLGAAVPAEESGWWAPLQEVVGQWAASRQIVRIEGGASHTVALLTDGSVWAWGGNSHGQLGDGTTDSRSTPTAVSFAPNLLVADAAGIPLQAGATLTVEEGVLLAVALVAFDAPGAVPSYTVSFDGGAALPEGASLTVSANGASATFRWTPSYLQVNKADPDQRRNYPITFTATTAGGDTASHSFTICVVDIPQPPIAEAGEAARNVFEGEVVILDGSASVDPDGGALQYQWTVSPGSVSCARPNEAVCAFTAPAVGYQGLTLTFTLTVKDDDNKTSIDVVTVTVGNVWSPPSATVERPSLTVASGAVFTLTGTGTPGDGYIVSSGWTLDGASVGAGNTLALVAPEVETSTSRTYQFTVTNSHGLTATAVVTVTVQPVSQDNDPPQVGSIQTPTLPLRVGEPLTVTAEVSDDAVGSAPPTVTWTWSDGTVLTDAAPAQAAGSAPAWTSTVTRYDLAPDVYAVTVQATDAGGAASEPKAHDKYVVVYDPEGGFVSGGGTLQPPVGAVSGSEVTGQATFGFTAKYRQSAPAPEGTLNFQLKAAGIDFRADGYEWLTVSGARARVRGRGTLKTAEGLQDCGFLLAVNDGKAKGGGGGHKFRLKIWNEATNEVVFDNQRSSSRDVDQPVQPLSGGTVVVKDR